MFIHILNLTHEDLHIAVGSEFAILAAGLEILPTLPWGTEADLWKWQGCPSSLPTLRHHI